VDNTVFIINKSGHDYSAAREYGELVYLSHGRWSRYDINKMYRQFQYKLRNSKPTDYILLTGLPTMQGMAMSIMALKHGCINTLHLKQKGGRKFYIERNIEFDLPTLIEKIPSNIDWDKLREYLNSPGVIIPIKKGGRSA